jgi:hypothetical protein
LALPIVALENLGGRVFGKSCCHDDQVYLSGKLSFGRFMEMRMGA